MPGRLQGKVALITGAGSGIGAACAVAFAREGARIAAADLELESAAQTARQITDSGGDALALAGDVSKRKDAESLVAATVARLGRVDVLVNSAGVSPRAAPKEWDFEQVWDWVMAVNLKGTVLVSKFAADRMVGQGSGSIVNLSSIYGLVGRPGHMGIPLDPYVHSKGGVSLLTMNLANHLAKKGVRVNALCPAFVYTNLTKSLTDDPQARKMLEDLQPMGRLGRPEEVAAAALFLASDEASFITGVCLPVDGGYTSQ